MVNTAETKSIKREIGGTERGTGTNSPSNYVDEGLFQCLKIYLYFVSWFGFRDRDRDRKDRKSVRERDR